MATFIREAPEFYFTHRGVKITVPSHFIRLPEIEMKPADALHYERFIEKPKSVIEQDLFEVLYEGWKYKVKWYLRYWARYYYDSYPSTRRSDGTLEGFDPDRLLAYYWPYEENDGQRKAHIRQEINRWGEKVRERAEERIREMLTSATPD